MLGTTGPLETIIGLALLLPSLAAGARRLHDGDRSAWWLLLMLVPVLGWIALIVLFAMKGTEGPNQYGADPLGGAGSAEA